MRKLLPLSLKGLIFSGLLLLMNYSSYASHIVAAELRYKWVSGNTYTITTYLYGDCGSTTGAFNTLPITTPQICIYDGNTYVATISLSLPSPTCGTEVTPVCPDSLLYTNCVNPSYSLPGIMKFVSSGNYTLPHTSANWRFIYTSNNGGTFGSWSCGGTLGSGSGAPSASGRSAAITSIVPGSSIQLIDTLNNSATNTRGNNSSPVLTVEPIPYYCAAHLDCYNPGAVDIYDVGPGEPAGDSLTFSLVNATNGTSSCGSIGGSVSYLFGLSGSNPLQLSSGTLSFDAMTGQMCFTPIVQRSVVVYNVDEYRNDTITTTPLVVNKVKVGTLQREMTFLVKTCAYTTPIGGIDSAGGAGISVVDSYHVYSCANSGTFSLKMNPTESDTSLHITITATGLSAGFVFTVINNGTSSPIAYLTGNTSTIVPGHYVIYLTYTDNHCPLVGSQTYPFTIDILPVPTVTVSTIVAATCASKAVVKITPGGTGKPWTIKLSHRPPLLPLTLDTFMVYTFDTSSVTDSLSPGNYYATIFTDVGNLCHQFVAFTVDTPHFNITATFTNPTYCGAANGTIRISGLTPGAADTLLYKFSGTYPPHVPIVASAAGTDTLTGLLAGVYDSIVAQEGFCFTNPATPRPLTLVNPPFIWRNVTTHDVSRCGYCDGSDTLYGIHPGQIDTVTYTYIPANPPGGSTAVYTVSRTIGSDSTVVMTGLCAGVYNSFTVNTAGVCSYTLPGSFVINQPRIAADFDSVIHYGCNGDTLFFNNLSYPNINDMADSILTYKWTFGDGTTSIETNPEHLYYPTNGVNYTVKLFITNGKCIDSSISNVFLNNFVVPSFSLTPTPFVCQLSPVTFTNTSIGTNLSYTWLFGDGTTDNTANPTHAYTTTGTYKIKMIAADHVLPTPQFFTPCYDTAYATISVDSISAASIQATDTVICRGQAIDFNGIFSHLGDTLINWNFGDGNGTNNVNPIVHAFDGTGTFTITLDVKYRACPETTATRNIRAYAVPDVYLGPDTAICPGSNAIVIADNQNAQNPKATWKWNTGETTSSIVATKPGEYSTVVTINGCTASDTILVQKDCYMDIPNIFTPNGDGVNDFFYPRQLLTKGIVQFKMDVFNRWGQLVYETESTDGRGWDGTFNDKAQPDGVYVYVIDVKFKDGQIEHHQGNVTLMR